MPNMWMGRITFGIHDGILGRTYQLTFSKYRYMFKLYLECYTFQWLVFEYWFRVVDIDFVDDVLTPCVLAKR